MMTYEVKIEGFGSSDEALAAQTPIARLVCPVADHDGPCEVPWGFTLSDGHALVLGIYASPQEATAIADEVRRTTGHRVTLTEAAPGAFGELEEQYRVEHPTA
ncbi:hypothetical protein [Kribbella sp. NPDC048915]|uniref:hypothetical protein n=1 Tax=Kribbella sp. NPDC048915 TaxID=3155148 RepID=UPI00340D4022